MRYLFTATTLCVIPLLLSGSASAEELRPSFLMFSDPEFEPPPRVVVRLPENIVEFWRSALRRPEAFYRLSAAIDIDRASRQGFNEVEAAVPELRQLLRAESTTRDVRIQVALTLIELDARDAAEELFQASREEGSQFRQLVEPALAAWDHRAIRQVWRDRLQAAKTPRRELILACEGCGRVRDEQALPALLALMHTPARPLDVRYSAAKAAGEITARGLEPEARKLLAEETPSLINRLCAVALLQRHASTESQSLLQEMFHDPSGPVAASAIQRLYDLDPALVLELVPRAWEHPDAKVRRVAADCLIALVTPDRIETLADHLNDAHPGLRRHIRNALLEFAQRTDLESTVRQSAVGVLNSDDWRGQEQACLILGQLDQESVAPRLIELLKSKRPEVQIASAWALRKVEVKEVLPAMFQQAQSQTDDPQGTDLAAVDRQVAHLFEAMTIMDYRPAIPLMRTQVPKPPDVDTTHRRLSRGAAVWGLGYFLADENDEEFAAQLMARLQDVYAPMMEISIVRHMSAVSLGRTKAGSQLESLKRFAGSEVSHQPIDEAMRWAIHEISGEELPYRQDPPYVPSDWRIQPDLPE